MHRTLQGYGRRRLIPRTERWGAHLGRFEDWQHLAPSREELDTWSDVDRRMEQRVDAVLQVPPATMSVLHGDIGLHHVRLASGDTDKPYFFDFSDFSYGPVVLDLAAFLAHAYRHGDIGFERWERLRAWLLEGYEAVLPLHESERGALDDLVLERLLVDARYLNRVAARSGGAPDAGVMRRIYRLAGYLLGRDQHTRERRVC